MAIADALLPEYDHEIATTRTLLERVPAKPAWKPHAKSMELGRLSMHIAELPTWVGNTLKKTELDVAPVDPSQRYVAKPFTTTQALVADFDAHAKEARAVLAATPDEAVSALDQTLRQAPVSLDWLDRNWVEAALGKPAAQSQ